jgi:hypothetical protein
MESSAASSDTPNDSGAGCPAAAQTAATDAISNNTMTRQAVMTAHGNGAVSRVSNGCNLSPAPYVFPLDLPPAAR